MFGLLIGVALALAGVAISIQSGGDGEASAWPVAVAVIGALALLYIATHYTSRAEGRAGRVLLWAAAIAASIFGASALRGAATGNVALLFASKPAEDAAGPRNSLASVRVRRSAQGYIANSEVNGEMMSMMIDSGAATVVLRQSDAIRAGIDTNSLSFDTPLMSANGTSFMATARLKRIHIGPIVVEDVEALVAKPGALSENLLGMSFLRRLASYELAGDFATLRQ